VGISNFGLGVVKIDQTERISRKFSIQSKHPQLQKNDNHRINNTTSLENHNGTNNVKNHGKQDIREE